MKRITFAFAVAVILASVSFSLEPFGMSSAEAAQKAVRPALGRPLKEAQALAKSGDYRAALAKVKEANAVSGKSAYENFVVDDFLLFINAKLKDYAAAARAGEAALATGEVDVKDRPQRLKTLVQLNYTAKSYSAVIAFAKQYQQEAGYDADLQMLVTQAYYLQSDYDNAEAAAKALVATTRTAGRKPDESLLQLWLSASFKKDDNVGSRAALMALVQDYPTPAYWADLLTLTGRDVGGSDRLTFEIFRLKLATGTMKSADDYMEMAQLAIQLGLPGEAESVLAKGFALGALGRVNKSRELRLQEMAKQQVAQDKPALGGTAATPKAKAALGEAYAAYGKYDKAISLYKEALSVSFREADLTRLHLGQAHLAEGNAADARKAFAAVKDLKLGQLAHIWLVVADQQG
ncbi:MAG: hypothetical protein K8R18_12690 [Parvibaculum sp.]|uniref:hypothetical protein n=1 Tax=Parvibaculum sp. TaxID=2024848 RepID=UPI0025DBF36C|nr:hypothetical protein [Parvibaculum sp.]MCE9650471.1 hypothetical protein [Parvibaculum sp.]